MKTLECSGWDDFELKLSELYKFRDNRKVKSRSHTSDLLFRGQANHEWELRTTLERFIPGAISLSEYYRIISKSKSEIETFSKKSWEIPTYTEYEKWLEQTKGLFFGDFYAYDYMAYLRHYGFPSPLLDWTLSPYIAAFFAFNKTTDQTKYGSIYAFLEFSGKGKVITPPEPNIFSLGKYVKTDKRHFLQQSQYTICTNKTGNSASDIFYSKHDDVIIPKNEERDMLWKLNIPASERIKILKNLARYNINAFSLFNSEETLMETIATREFFLKE